MIINFLYKMDEKNKRAIIGMIVDDNLVEYDPLKQYELILEDGFKLQSGQRIVSNLGIQYYGITTSGKKTSYINVNDYMLSVKANLTDKLSFATTVSKEMIDELIKQTSNFNEQSPLKLVEAGYNLMPSGSYKDYFGILFKKVTDNVYCQFHNGKKPLFVGRENENYFITDDFNKASRVKKNEVRPLLVTRGYVSSSTDRATLTFSTCNVFHDGKSYGFGGNNSFKVTYEDNILTISKDFIPDNTFKLVNDERRFELLKDICYGFKKDKKNIEKNIVVNRLYASAIDDFTVKFVDNASLATTFDERDIDILFAAYSLFNEEATFDRVCSEGYYCYFKGSNHYHLSTELLDFKSNLIKEATYDLFKKSFKEITREDGVLLTSVNKYVKMTCLNETEFVLDFVDTGFDATIFSIAQANVLTEVLQANFKRKELKPIQSIYHDYPVKNAPVKPLKAKYEELLAYIETSSIKLNAYPKLDELKTVSDKSALEYLKSLYPKCVMDAYGIFNLILNASPEVKNVLIVGATATCDLQGLAYACERNAKEIHVWTSETTKWGYVPACELGEKLIIKNRYRLPISSFPKDFLEQFDLIYFGKNFNEDEGLVFNLLKNLKKCNKKIYLANTNLCEIGSFYDSFYQAISKDVKVNRKYNNLKLEAYGLDIEDMSVISLNSPMISNKISYQNILKVENGRIIDLFKKKNA